MIGTPAAAPIRGLSIINPTTGWTSDPLAIGWKLCKGALTGLQARQEVGADCDTFLVRAESELESELREWDRVLKMISLPLFPNGTFHLLSFFFSCDIDT